MTKTILLAATLAAVFVLSMIMVPVLAAGHVVLDPPNTAAVIKGNSLKATITATAPIPVDGSSAFGYAILTTTSGSPASNNVLVLVTHVGFDDSSFEDPVSGFHTHVLDLKAPTAPCVGVGATDEVDLATSPSNTGFDKKYPFKIAGNVATINHAKVSDLNGGSVAAIAAFLATVPSFTAGVPDNICVTVISFG